MAKYFQIKNSKKNKIFIRESPLRHPLPNTPLRKPPPRYPSVWHSDIWGDSCFRMIFPKISIVSKPVCSKNFFQKFFTCSKTALPKIYVFLKGVGVVFKMALPKKIFSGNFSVFSCRTVYFAFPSVIFLVNGR